MILFASVSVMMKVKKMIVSEEKRTGDLQNMSNVVGGFARKILGKKAFAEADVICNWQNIAGKDLACFSKPVRIDFKKGERVEGTLFIEVASGAFALEIQSKTKILVDKVNSFFGYAAVNSIKIIQNPAVFFEENANIKNVEKKLVTIEEENYITDLSKDVKNPELESALQSLGRAVLINNKK